MAVGYTRVVASGSLILRISVELRRRQDGIDNGNTAYRFIVKWSRSTANIHTWVSFVCLLIFDGTETLGDDHKPSVFALFSSNVEDRLDANYTFKMKLRSNQTEQIRLCSLQVQWVTLYLYE